MTDHSLKGTNWGRVDIDDKNLALKHLTKNVIKFPLKRILNSNLQRNDIVLQLSTDDYQENEDKLCEVRFYIPSNVQKAEKKKLEQQEEEEEVTYQQLLQQQILNSTKIGVSTDSILTIHDVPFIVPRGKYTMDFFKKDIRFHGNTYQFTTEYKSIARFFLLPMPDEVNLSFVIGLDNPIKQGQTAYNYIVIQFKKDEEVEIASKYNRQQLDEMSWKSIKTQYSGLMYDIMCDILSEITGIKIISPKNFKSKENYFCVRCSVVPHSGYLFPLEKSLLYIQKPVVYIKHDEIKEIILQRISATQNQNKFFDIKVVTKYTSHLFSAIEKEELDKLQAYFHAKKLNVKKLQEEVQREESENDAKQIAIEDLDSDEDDEDFDVQDVQDGQD